MPLADFNDTKQTFKNACGAFALAAALDSRSVFPPPDFFFDLLDLTSLDAYKSPAPAEKKTTFSQFLYEGTGNLVLDFHVSTATYTYKRQGTPDDWPMNSPSALVSMASYASRNALRIKVHVLEKTKNTFEAFTVYPLLNLGLNSLNLFDQEESLIKSIPCNGGNAEVEIYDNTYTYTWPQAGETHLVLVAPTVGPNAGQPNHWITADNTHWYDPGAGTANTVQSLPPNIADLTQYGFAGLWISLSQ